LIGGFRRNVEWGCTICRKALIAAISANPEDPKIMVIMKDRGTFHPTMTPGS
jgi:hypothetical protein